jgi:hypothetical protein
VTLHLLSLLAVGGSSNVDKMTSTHPNMILSVAMSFMRQNEEISKKPILIFLGRPTVTFQFPGQNIQIQISWFLLIRSEK